MNYFNPFFTCEMSHKREFPEVGEDYVNILVNRHLIQLLIRHSYSSLQHNSSPENNLMYAIPATVSSMLEIGNLTVGLRS